VNSYSDEQTVRYWASRWRQLVAWRRPLGHVTFATTPYKGRGVMGYARLATGVVMIELTGDVVEDLGTALHELAHFAAPRSHHGESWQAMYAAAVLEVAGVVIPRDTKRNMDRSARGALGLWWTRSGNAFALELLRRVGERA